jgi:outer membrane protein TolC
MIRLTATAAALVLAGCASFSPDGGANRVAELTKERTGQAPAHQRTARDVDTAQARVAELLNQPLTADSAVELAFLNNRGLQASFSELGIAESELVRAGRLRNPSISFGRLREAGGVVEVERAVMFDLLGLLTLPVASQVEQRRFAQAQLQTAHEAVGIAADTRKAYFSAVAAQELVKYHAQVKEAADASSELARRMVQAGNFSKLAQVREQAFYADAMSQLARAQHQAVAERERLTRLLGLSGHQAFVLPDRLPELPKQPTEPKDAEQAAMEKRLDVLMAKRAAEHTARSLGLTKTTRFINVLELGYQNKSATGEPRANGYEIELELPLFDFGSTRAARAEATYMQAVHRTAQVAVDARSEVRESYSAYRASYDLAVHYRDEVVPLRKRISEENLLRYNGMLIGVFELLADARDQVSSVTGYVEALRDYWIAETNLQTALTGRSPGPVGASRASASAAPAESRGH